MATIEKFEGIEAWKVARNATRMVYAASSNAVFCRDFALVNQIRRASISVMSNIAEGFERTGIRSLCSSWRWPRVRAAKFVPNCA